VATCRWVGRSAQACRFARQLRRRPPGRVRRRGQHWLGRTARGSRSGFTQAPGSGISEHDAAARTLVQGCLAHLATSIPAQDRSVAGGAAPAATVGRGGQGRPEADVESVRLYSIQVVAIRRGPALGGAQWPARSPDAEAARPSGGSDGAGSDDRVGFGIGTRVNMGACWSALQVLAPAGGVTALATVLGMGISGRSWTPFQRDRGRWRRKPPATWPTSQSRRARWTCPACLRGGGVTSVRQTAAPTPAGR